MLAAETQYSIIFTSPGIKLCLRLHYNGSNSFLYNFSVDYRALDIRKIINIHKSLMKKHDIK